jgi:NADH:ubiquinone oxidoreductase subunit 6 (subunit J)
MTPNAVAFYAVAVLIVLAAGAAVGLPSLRHAAFGGAAVIVLMAVLEVISGAYALAVVQLVVPGVAAGVITLVLRRDAYRGLNSAPNLPERFWIAAPIAVGTAAVLVVTLAAAGSGWYPGTLIVTAPAFHIDTALVTVLHYRTPYALAIAVAAVVVTIGAALVIGRRSADEQTLDQLLAHRRQREELALRRRQDREQGRRRPARNDP